jgi:hypothetical protein
LGEQDVADLVVAHREIVLPFGVIGISLGEGALSSPDNVRSALARPSKIGAWGSDRKPFTR